MTTMEHAPQRPKTYDGRKQDHGDAATQTLDRGKDEWDYQNGTLLREKVHLDLSLQDIIETESPSSAQLEAAADELLGESNDILADEDEYYLEDDAVDTYVYPTEVDLGLPTREEIRKRMAHRATLDVRDDDDDGDDGFEIPVHIRRV